MGDHYSFSVAVSTHIAHHLSLSQFQIICCPIDAGTELVTLVTPVSVEMGPQPHSQWKWAPSPILSGNGGSPLIFSSSEYSHSPSSIFITVSDCVLPNRAGTELVTLVTAILSGNGPPAPFSVEMGGHHSFSEYSHSSSSIFIKVPD
jgi:hypothetical protein